MEELIEKVEQLKMSIDSRKEIIDIKKLNTEIMNDEELLLDIKKYQELPDEKIKERIVNNPLFLKYKKKETDVNILVLTINQALKELLDKGNGCR